MDVLAIEERDARAVRPLERLIELYQQAWLFCLPSSYEGFGVPYIEAMSCGTPVVATPNAGAREVLEEMAGGTLPEAIAVCVLLLLVLIPYFSFRGLASRLGDGVLWKHFTERRSDRAP